MLGRRVFPVCEQLCVHVDSGAQQEGMGGDSQSLKRHCEGGQRYRQG